MALHQGDQRPSGLAIVCAFAALGILITGGAIWWGLEFGGIIN
jgi:hypothetical protein